MTEQKKSSRHRLIGFIVFSVIEETIIGVIGFVIILLFFPALLIPGIIVIAIGLALFTVIKIYFYWTSSAIPIEDPILGQKAVAIQDFHRVRLHQWEGKVRFQGEIWRAQANSAIKDKTIVLVERIEGLCLYVNALPSTNKHPILEKYSMEN